jgi:hypothetical protein
MIYHYNQQSYLSKTVLAGVFAGIAGTLMNLGYDFIFRMRTEFPLSQVVNVSTIIFSTMLFFTVAGVVYFFLSRVKKGELLYIVLLLALGALSMKGVAGVNRSPIALISEEFRYLIFGILGINFLLATFGIPYLMHHQHIFLDEMDYVDADR